MSEFETTINTLNQLNQKIYKEHWDDIRLLEDEDDRYTIALIKAISILGVFEQIRWERDVAISQLEELGLSLGQKVDHVKEAIDKATPMKLKEVKGMYDITKPVCPRCGDDLFGEYCSECGQKLTQE